MAAGMTFSLFAFFLLRIHRFLAVTNPVGNGVLVVEAWIPAPTLAESATQFNSGSYRYLVVVGGPMDDGSGRPDPATYADLAERRLEKAGFDTKKLVKLTTPAEPSLFGRTLDSAMAVRGWLHNSDLSVCCVDVFTAGVHARKSWILFRYALGGMYRVGIIAGSPTSYDPRFWPVSRRGAWLVARNLAGCVYSELWILFHRSSTR